MSLRQMRFFLVACWCVCGLTVMAQHRVSLKNNLLYDATLTPNLGLELRLDSCNSVQTFYGLNPWKFAGEKKLRHWSLMPEWRRWLGRTFKGHFVGLHALVGEYNVGGIGPFSTLRHNHYEGWYVGGGLTYGYAWRLADHWNLEAAVGVGYVHTAYDKFENGVCGYPLGSGHRNYVGPTKLALNLAYLFGGRKPAPVVVETEPEPVIETYRPDWHFSFATPQAEAQKVRQYSGRAFLDFPVNKTDIRPTYRRNERELATVRKTIDVVRLDTNATITHVSIHGYASPEGSYANNIRLAAGRAQAFKDYIRLLIQLPDDCFDVKSTPEDWQGFFDRREQLEALVGSVQTAADIMAVAADERLQPDEKEQTLRRQYPQQWRLIVDSIFVALRHSDYVVSYTVRPFTVAEAMQIIKTKPQHLSLGEMFVVAQQYEEGSPEYVEVFETAVRMYPDDPVANLNAAVNALRRGDVAAARRYADRAGTSADALNLRGVLATKNGDPAGAEALFRQAGNADALHNLEEMRRVGR